MILNESRNDNAETNIPARYVPIVKFGDENKVNIAKAEIQLNPDSQITKENLAKDFFDGILAFRGSEGTVQREIESTLKQLHPPVLYAFEFTNQAKILFLPKETALALLHHYESSDPTNATLPAHIRESIKTIAYRDIMSSERPAYATQWPGQVKLPNGDRLTGEELRGFLLRLILPIFEMSKEDEATRTLIHELRHVGQRQMNGSLGAIISELYPDMLEKINSNPNTIDWLFREYPSDEIDTMFFLQGIAYPFVVLSEADSMLHQIFGTLAPLSTAEHFSEESFNIRAIDLVVRFLQSFSADFPKKFIRHDMDQLLKQDQLYTFYSPYSIGFLVLIFGDTDFDPETILSKRIIETPETELLGQVISKVIEIQKNPRAWFEKIKSSNLEEKILDAIAAKQLRALRLINEKIEAGDSFLTRNLSNLETLKKEIDVYLSNS